MKNIHSILLLCLFLSFSWVLSAQETIQVEAKSTRKKVGSKNTYSAWRTYETQTVNLLPGFKPQPEDFTRYGFLKNLKGKKTGFFHTEKINGRWWIVDPDGHAGFSLMINNVEKGLSPTNEKAFKRKFKDDSDWMKQTMAFFREIGFNGTGCWSDDDAIRAYNKSAKYPFAYSRCLYWMRQYAKEKGVAYHNVTKKNPNKCIFVFDPEFEKYCMERAKELVQYADDPNLLGYFTDNELPILKVNMDGYLNFPKSDPGRQAVDKYLKEKGIEREDITDEHRLEFAGIVAEKYYSIVSKALRTYDKNHMFLGTRLNSGTKHIKGVIEACGRHADILSVNYYGSWDLTKKHYEDWAKYADIPFQITEFYTKGEDTGMPNISGSGWIVKTQKDRGYAYQHFCLSMLKAPNCVGWHWFKYQDNDPEAVKDPSNVDANKGMVDNNYNPYTDLSDLMKQLNLNYPALLRYYNRY